MAHHHSVETPVEATTAAPPGVRRISTETKAAAKTTELIAYVVVAIAVLVASAVVDDEDFGSQDAFFLVTLLTIGYMISRGLAKSGSRDYYDNDMGRGDHRFPDAA